MRLRRNRSARFLRWLLVGALAAALLAQAAPLALADDPRAELEKVQDQLSYIQKKRQETKNLLSDAYWQSEEARVQLKNVEGDLAIANSQLAVLTNQARLAEQDLKKVQTEVEEATREVASHKATLQKRVRAINEEGRVNYVAVLLGASSFSDLLSRFDMLTLVVRKDAELFARVRESKRLLDEKKIEAETRRNRLTELTTQAEARRNTIAIKRDERVAYSNQLEFSKKQLQSQLDAFDKAEEEIGEKVAELQRQLARQGGLFAPVYPVNKPIAITDSFGPRLHPILGVWRNHNGTDFAANYGAPVYAIDDGVVLVAGWNEAYGWLVVIDHGGGVSSWYGHATKLLVKVNETVHRGQKITEAGATGWATGPHLHLEIRVDGKPEDPMKYYK